MTSDEHARDVSAYQNAFGASDGWPAREDMTIEDEELWVLATFEEHLFGKHLEDGEYDLAGLFVYMRHCGMGPTLDAIQAGQVLADRSVEDIVLAHYRLPSGRYDLDKVVENFSTQPHIVARIAYPSVVAAPKRIH